MSNLEASIVLAGVGGQGTLIAGKLLGIVAMKLGLDVKVSEVHGMSQRGGSVVTYVKFGKNIYSPIIGKGEADIILAFEMLEAYRALPYLKKGGKMIVNRQCIDPMPVITGAMEYPKDIEGKLCKKADAVFADALKMAKEAGNAKAVNVVLIGMMAKNTDISYDIWIDTIKKTVPEKFLEVNLKAFDSGYRNQEEFLDDISEGNRVYEP